MALKTLPAASAALELAWTAMRERREADALALLSEMLHRGEGDEGVVRHELSLCCYNLGLIDQALAHNERALAAGVGDGARAFRAVALPQLPGASPAEVLAARQAWAGATLPSVAPVARAVPPAGGLPRIGFFCSYFHDPGWMKPVWALINALDREKYAVFLYTDGVGPPFTSGYRLQAADRVRETGALDAEDCASCMAADGLDVLVELNGHSQARRLAVIKYKPACRCFGWFNYYATSGLSAAEGMDGLLGDAVVAPAGAEEFFSERILRLPVCYLSFSVQYAVPEVSPLPCLLGAPFTFGCLTSLYKLTPPVIEVWARILHEAAHARLLIRNGGLGTEANRRHLAGRFAEHGISEDRLILEGPMAHGAFLETYARVDLQLDPWPYTGGTTTSESLWQGVPVLTKTGPRWIERVSHSLLHYAGLEEEWVVPNECAYRQKACEWAQPSRWRELASVRAGLRERSRRSAVGDAEGLARAFLLACGLKD